MYDIEKQIQEFNNRPNCTRPLFIEKFKKIRGRFTCGPYDTTIIRHFDSVADMEKFGRECGVVVREYKENK